MPTNVFYKIEDAPLRSLSLSHKKKTRAKTAHQKREAEEEESVFWNRRSVVFLLFLLVVVI